MKFTWREYLYATVFLSLFGAGCVATISNGSMPQMKGAWVAQAMR